MFASSGFASILITCSVVTLVKTKECVLDHRSGENGYEQDLLDHLRCSYDFYMQNLEQNATEINVTAKFFMRYFSLDDQQDIFSTHSWLYMTWNDPRIKWNPQDYGGVDSIVTHFVAIPSLRLTNAANGDDLDYFDRVPCLVDSAGIISCMSGLYYEASCITNLTDWPYDSQTCYMEFTPWITRGNKVNLQFDYPAVSMTIAAYGSQWTITEFDQKENVSVDVQMQMSFTMEREAAGLAAIIVHPSGTLSVLTISCLVLDVRKNVRLLLICFSLYCHFFFLVEISINLPKHGESSPTILLYYRGALVLTMLAMLVTCLLKYLCAKESEAPVWVRSCNGFVANSLVRFLLYPRWDSEHEKCTEWTNLANMINSACIIVLLTVYVSMYFSFIPQPIPFNV